MVALVRAAALTNFAEVARALGHDPLPGLLWRDSGLMRDQAAASPGIWHQGALLAAPLLQPAPGITVTPLRDLPEFQTMLYVH